MKKKLVFLCLLCLLCLFATGQQVVAQVPLVTPVVLTLEGDGHGTGANGSPKTPVQPPFVGINGHTLYFPGINAPFVLSLVDGDNNEVYVQHVPGGDNQLVIPSSILGNYVLRLDFGTCRFVGEVEL